MNIRTKLNAGFLSLAAITLIVGAVGYGGIRQSVSRQNGTVVIKPTAPEPSAETEKETQSRVRTAQYRSSAQRPPARSFPSRSACC